MMRFGVLMGLWALAACGSDSPCGVAWDGDQPALGTMVLSDGTVLRDGTWADTRLNAGTFMKVPALSRVSAQVPSRSTVPSLSTIVPSAGWSPSHATPQGLSEPQAASAQSPINTPKRIITTSIVRRALARTPAQ